MSVIICVFLLVALIASGIPIAFALAVAGSAGLVLISGFDSFWGILQTTPYRTTAVYLLSTVPMFILMAEFASVGITRDIFDFAARITKRFKMPGGLGIATVIASAIFAAVSGSSTASAATLTKIAFPEMRRYGYSSKMALGIVASGGTLAVMIPPSIGLILYGILADVSIGKLLIAGIIPGIISAATYCFVIVGWYRHDHKDRLEQEYFDQTQDVAIVSQVIRMGPTFFVIFSVLGGIYLGIVTPTEAAALGACATLIVGWIKGDLRISNTIEACKRAASVSAMIFTIMIGAKIFGYFLTMSRSTQELISFLDQLSLPPSIILCGFMAFYLILGCLMDGIAILLLTVPLIVPIVSQLGYDLIWWGIVTTKLIEIGLITPPVGINIFVSASAAGVSVEEGFAGVKYMLLGDAISFALIAIFPILSLYLVNASF